MQISLWRQPGDFSEQAFIAAFPWNTQTKQKQKPLKKQTNTNHQNLLTALETFTLKKKYAKKFYILI